MTVYRHLQIDRQETRMSSDAMAGELELDIALPVYLERPVENRQQMIG